LFEFAVLIADIEHWPLGSIRRLVYGIRVQAFQKFNPRLVALHSLLSPGNGRVASLQSFSRAVRLQKVEQGLTFQAHTQIISIAAVLRRGRWLWRLCQVGTVELLLVLVKLLFVSHGVIELGYKAAHPDSDSRYFDC
jgi:hypothetical protein